MSLKAVKPAFILTVKIYLKPEDVASFLTHFRPIYEKCLAEPECAYFLFGENLQEPGVIQWTEGWTKDPQWFQTEQMTKEYYKPYFEATEPMFIKPREAGLYLPTEGLMHFKE